MLIQHKADVCATSKAAQTALHFAAEMGHVDVVAALLDAAGKQLIVMKDQGNWTPLHHAAEQGSVDIVELLIFVSRLCTCCLLCMLANGCSCGPCSLGVNLHGHRRLEEVLVLYRWGHLGTPCADITRYCMMALLTCDVAATNCHTPGAVHITAAGGVTCRNDHRLGA